METDRRYTNLQAVPSITTGQRLTIKYRALDFKTLPEKQQYRVRTKGLDADWQKSTKANTFDIALDEAGTYTFEVQAIDRDLNYSEPARVTLNVIDDPRDAQIEQLEGELERRNRELEVRNLRLERAYDELKRTQAELVQSEKMAGLGQIVAGVAHEINNPVNFIFFSLSPLERNLNVILQIFDELDKVYALELPQLEPVLNGSIILPLNWTTSQRGRPSQNPRRDARRHNAHHRNRQVPAHLRPSRGQRQSSGEPA